MGSLGKRGVLNPRAAAQSFDLTRRAPSVELAPFVERYWLIEWDRRGEPPFDQDTLSYPCVNLVFGTHKPGLHGVGTKRTTTRLEGHGWVVGVKFRAGTFRPFWSEAVSSLTDRSLPIATAFGEGGRAAETAVLEAPSREERVHLVEAFLLSLAPRRDPQAERMAELVTMLEQSPSMTRVAMLAEHEKVSTRTLQRMFDEYVGVPPKWVVRRFRVQDAAQRIERGEGVDGAALAQELGFTDQAHFIRDFKEHVGRTPRAYAAFCAKREAETASAQENGS